MQFFNKEIIRLGLRMFANKLFNGQVIFISLHYISDVYPKSSQNFPILLREVINHPHCSHTRFSFVLRRSTPLLAIIISGLAEFMKGHFCEVEMEKNNIKEQLHETFH